MKHLTSLAISPHLWRSIPCHLSELRLDYVLAGGQSFRWKESSPGYWTGVLHGRVCTLTQEGGYLWYAVYPSPGTRECELEMNTQKKSAKRKLPHNISKSIKRKKDTIKQENEVVTGDNASLSTDCMRYSDIFQDYFQLHVSLGELYSIWGASDQNFLKVAKEFSGIRILRQDPVECLFSFICTSNNHISRITGMIERLCTALGKRLCQLDMVEYYSFPTLQSLAADDTEAKLRDLGFGYRAKFVSESARSILHKKGCDWLDNLRLAPYEEAKSALCGLPGVGAKVADCVCLMALDKPEAVPVDTHVWQIAKRDYLPQLGHGNKTLTDRVYREIGDYFRCVWGPYAGWAQGVLFCSDLKKFRESSGYKPKAKTKKKPTG